MADYYCTTEPLETFLIWNNVSTRTIFNSFGYFPTIFGGFGFVLFTEKNKKYYLTTSFFTDLYFALIIIYMIAFFIDINLTKTLSASFLIFYIYLLIYMIDLIKKAPIKSLKLVSGFIFLFVGYLCTTDVGVTLGTAVGLGIRIRLYGSLSNIVSSLLISLFFLSLPPFSEFDWQDAVEDIFIINKIGVCLFYQSKVNEDDDIMSKQSCSAAITSLKIFLEETTQNEGVSVIMQKEKIMVIYPGEFLTGVITANKKFKSIELGLKEFIDKVETIYRSILIELRNSIDESIFEPLTKISKSIFYK